MEQENMVRYGLAMMVNSVIVMAYGIMAGVLANGGTTTAEMVALVIGAVFSIVVIFVVGLSSRPE